MVDWVDPITGRVEPVCIRDNGALADIGVLRHEALHGLGPQIQQADVHHLRLQVSGVFMC